MKKILTIALLFCSVALMAQQKRGRLVLNPLSGKLEYVENIYAMSEVLINSGYDNVTFQSLNTIFGFGNVLNDNSIAFGWNNYANCNKNFMIGKNLMCNGDKTISIGQGFEPNMPGSVNFGYNSERPTLTIHSGYPMPNDGYVGDIGAVRIGYRRGGHNEDSTALEITGFELFYGEGLDNYGTPPGTQFIATENDDWTVGLDGMELTGTFSMANLECDFVPHVYSGAADTSLLPTPFKIGDYYINTTGREVYISTGTSLGKWRKVN